MATVGELDVEPAASNVIPGRVTLSLDFRHAEDSVRESVGTRLRERAEAIAEARGLALEWEVVQETRAVACSPELAGAPGRGGGGVRPSVSSACRAAPATTPSCSRRSPRSRCCSSAAPAASATTRPSPWPSRTSRRRSTRRRGSSSSSDELRRPHPRRDRRRRRRTRSPLDVGVADGLIAALGPELARSAAEEIDATGLHVLPGVVDAHVHMNEPGRTDWEGFETGTRALAAGGATAAIDMPLNAHPPTVTGAAFDEKRRCLERSALVDMALWGGLVPGGVEAMDELAARGVVGFKAFMCSSGIDDFPASTTSRCTRGCAARRRSGCPSRCTPRARRSPPASRSARVPPGGPPMRDFLASRPAVAELQAIARAIALAQESGCSLHVVHVSTGRGVALVAEARARGVDVSCETCPHYLVLTEEDAEVLGNVAKCAPPLRPREEREALWRALADGTLPMVASDHSPAPWALKSARGRVRRLGRHLRLPDVARPAAERGPSRPGPRARSHRSGHLGLRRPEVPPPRQGPRRAGRRRRPRARRPDRLRRRCRPRTCTIATATARSSAGPSAPASRARSFAAGRCSPTAGSSVRPRGAC